MRILGLATLVGSLACASSAWAIPELDINDGTQVSENAFVSSLGSYTRETFNASPRTTGSSVSTAVGTFASTVAGQQGQIISIADGPIAGRGLAPFSGNFLESRDSTGVTWHATSATAFDAIGFFLQDAGDQGALLNITANDGSAATVTVQGGGNGNTRYVVIKFDHFVTDAAIDFVNTGNHLNADGWGLDNITVGRLIAGGGGNAVIPEPASLVSLASGLFGLGFLLRRRRSR
ncbi:PEP-CTERM sorting domain-containing protein [Roseiterribacter gracilis]|uniref:Ice-binding protein C-terminal domain-containing protein n=1 Tax=Roseiterribacter gracilis TaxID=2812848 RepID=A0A8S8XG34_9PROT|nr:hypothetical protein TMPK1_24430 [Rhodospirillales bacterium TMPK1]